MRAKRDDEFVLIAWHEPDNKILNEVGELFGLHELALEDALVAHQRPKLEDYEDFCFVMLKTARYDQRQSRSSSARSTSSSARST